MLPSFESPRDPPSTRIIRFDHANAVGRLHSMGIVHSLDKRMEASQQGAEHQAVLSVGSTALIDPLE